jgi:hypothetical protein
VPDTEQATLAEHEGAEVHRIGFGLLIGKKPGPYVPRTPVLGGIRRPEPSPYHGLTRRYDVTISKAERDQLNGVLSGKPAIPPGKGKPCEICGKPFYRPCAPRQRTCNRACGGKLKALRPSERKPRNRRPKEARCSPTPTSASSSPPGATSASTAAPPDAGPALPAAGSASS